MIPCMQISLRGTCVPSCCCSSCSIISPSTWDQPPKVLWLRMGHWTHMRFHCTYTTSWKSLNKRLTSGRVLRLCPPTHWMQFALNSSSDIGLHLRVRICICMCLHASVYIHICCCVGLCPHVHTFTFATVLAYVCICVHASVPVCICVRASESACVYLHSSAYRTLNIWIHSDANGSLRLDTSFVQRLLGCTIVLMYQPNLTSPTFDHVLCCVGSVGSIGDHPPSRISCPVSPGPKNTFSVATPIRSTLLSRKKYRVFVRLWLSVPFTLLLLLSPGTLLLLSFPSPNSSLESCTSGEIILEKYCNKHWGENSWVRGYHTGTPLNVWCWLCKDKGIGSFLWSCLYVALLSKCIIKFPEDWCCYSNLHDFLLCRKCLM